MSRIIFDLQRNKGVHGVEKIARWVATLPQETLREFKALNDAWWDQGDGRLNDTMGKIVSDFIEEHGGERKWFGACEFLEVSDDEHVAMDLR